MKARRKNTGMALGTKVDLHKVGVDTSRLWIAQIFLATFPAI